MTPINIILVFLVNDKTDWQQFHYFIIPITIKEQRKMVPEETPKLAKQIHIGYRESNILQYRKLKEQRKMGPWLPDMKKRLQCLLTCLPKISIWTEEKQHIQFPQAERKD